MAKAFGEKRPPIRLDGWTVPRAPPTFLQEVSRATTLTIFLVSSYPPTPKKLVEATAGEISQKCQRSLTDTALNCGTTLLLGPISFRSSTPCSPLPQKGTESSAFCLSLWVSLICTRANQWERSVKGGGVREKEGSGGELLGASSGLAKQGSLCQPP